MRHDLIIVVTVSMTYFNLPHAPVDQHVCLTTDHCELCVVIDHIEIPCAGF